MREKAALGALALWLVVPPVLLGSVPEARVAGDGWFAAFLSRSGGYLVFQALGLAAFLLAASARPLELSRSSRPILLCLLLLLGVGCLQLVPLPRVLHSLLAPAHARDAGILLPERSWLAASTDPGLTLHATVRIALLLLAATAVLRVARGPRRAWILVGAFAAAAALVSGYGILETGLLGDRVLGFSREFLGRDPTVGAVTGTFVYRGNFAAFAAAALGAAAAGLVAALRRRRPWLAGGAAMAVALLAAGLVLSRSRAGLAAGGLALALGLALPLRSRRAKAAVALLALAAVVGTGLSFGALRERFSYLTAPGGKGFLDIRVPAWGSTLELFAGRPVLGSGLGTYRRAIHLTQSPDNPDELWFAHSDPLNLLAEGGIAGLLPGAGLLLLGLLGAVRLARDRESPASGAGAACAAALAGLLAMSLVDFPLQIPALVLPAVVLVALPAALAGGPPAASPRLRRAAEPLCLAVLLGLGVLAWIPPLTSGAVTAGEADLREGIRLLGEGDLAGAERRLRSARRRQPFDAETRFRLAGLLYRRRDLEEARAEVRAAFRVARGKPDLLFAIGAVSLGDPALADLAPAAFREAGTAKPALFPRALGLAGERDPSLAPTIVPERSNAWPDPARAWALLARWYRARGEEEEGRRVFQAKGVPWPER